MTAISNILSAANTFYRQRQFRTDICTRTLPLRAR